MNKKYVLLFNLTERSHLQDNLNKIIFDYDDVEIEVWQDVNGWWSAFVRYSGEKYIPKKDVEEVENE